MMPQNKNRFCLHKAVDQWAVTEISISLADQEELPEDSANTRRRRRRKRKLDLDHLPHHRHELDVPEEEKICSCCEEPKEQIGEDITTVLEYEPSKLEVHEYVRPKDAPGQADRLREEPWPRPPVGLGTTFRRKPDRLASQPMPDREFASSAYQRYPLPTRPLRASVQ